MRVTRYLWINNLPPRVTEQEVRDVLQSHGKIQSVRIHEHAGNNGAIVAFVDTKSATKAMESTIRLKKVHLSLQYCESSGIPGSNTDHIAVPMDHYQTNHDNSVLQSDDSCSQTKSRSSSMESNSSSILYEMTQKEKANTSSYPMSMRNSSRDLNSGMIGSSSPRVTNDYRGLKISHLPLRSSDTNLREGLFHEYKKHGKITSVFVRGQGDERTCVITFKKCEDAQRALASSKGKVFFGTPISVVSHEGLDSEDPDLCPPEHALDEYHPKATKTLFVGNLCSNTTTQDELRRTFRVYGEIIEIDIKIQANQPGTSYAFIQYGDIASVVRALNDQDNVRVSGKTVKLGFGKSQPTNVVWLDNLAPNINESYLTRQFGRYGQLTHVVFDRKSLKALLYFDTVEMAQRALNETRNRAIAGRKVQLDYAGHECQVAFMRKLAKHDSFGQVYENYRERLQELLSLWPAYGGVLPFIDRQKYFQENQRDTSLHSGNTKFSYRRSNCTRNSSTDRVSKRDQLQSKGNISTSVSPHNRLQNNSNHFSLDRKRTFNISSDDSKVSGIWTGNQNNRNAYHNSANYGKLSTAGLANDDNKLHRRYQRAGDLNFNTSKSSRSAHSGGKSAHNSRLHSNYTSLRGRGPYLGDADEVSSGSFSSEMTADESPTEYPVKRVSSGSSERLAPASKTPSHTHRDRTINNNDKRRDHGLDTSRKSHRTHLYDSIHLEDSYSCSLKKQTHRNVDYMNSNSRTPSTHNSSRRSHRNSSLRSRTHTTQEQNCPLPNNRHRSGDDVSEKHSRSSCHAQRQSSKHSDLGDSNLSHHTKNKRNIYAHASSVPKDPEYTTRHRTSSITSPISSDDLVYSKKEGSYSTSIRVTDSEQNREFSNNSIKPHDALTKLELERAKLLRELSLLNNEVIGGSKSKSHTHTNFTDHTSKKRAPSLDDVDVPSSKIKCLEPDMKYDISQSRSPTFVDEQNLTSSIRHSKTNSSDHTVFKRSSASKRNQSPSYRTIVEKRNRGPLLETPCSDQLKPSPDSSINSLMISKSTDITNIHNSSKSISLSSHRMPLSDPNSASSSSFSQKSVLMTSSPRVPVQSEPGSPLNQLSPSNSLMSVSKSLFTASNILSVSSNPPSISTSGSKLSSNHGSGSRDPRLTIHQDVPPPPPPPPETFKLPLWVDTSAQLDVTSPNRLVSSSKPQSPLKSAPVVSESDIPRDPLDERIRLLDVQLMKSEKARPAVDYSKFRIRRKAEPGSNTNISNCTTSSQMSFNAPICGLYSSPTSTVNSFNLNCRPEHLTSNSTTSQLLSITSVCNMSSLPSPVLTNSSVVKPADTSEFVKSMLLSSKSLSSPCKEVPVCVSTSENIVTTKGTFPSPPTSSIFSRIPLTSATNDVSSIGTMVPAATNPLNTRPIGTNNQRSQIERSSLCGGALPVGVATRMPSIQSPCSIDTLPKLSDELVSSNQAYKPTNRRENIYTIEKSEQSYFSTSQHNEPFLKTYQASKFSTLSHNISRNKSPSEAPTKVTHKMTTNLHRLSSNEPNKENDHTDFGKSKPLNSFSPKSTVKPSKPDITRSTLDNSVFQTSWGSPISKIDRVKNKKKTFPGSLDQKMHVENIGSASSQSSIGNKQKTTQNLSAKFSTHKQQKVETQTLTTNAMKNKFHSTTDNVDLTNSNNNNNNSITKDQKPTISGVRKKKKMKDNRKHTKNIDESDWGPDSSLNSSQHNEMSDLLCEQRYESMYDKIKRRANKSLSSNDLHAKPALQHLMKSRGKQPKKIVARKSLADSDTDECLSDNNSDGVSHSGRTQKTQLELSDSLPKSSKQRTNSGSNQVKLTNITSTNMLSGKRKIQSNLNQVNLNQSTSKGKNKKVRKSSFSSSGPLTGLQAKSKLKTHEADVTTSTAKQSFVHTNPKKISRPKTTSETFRNSKESFDSQKTDTGRNRLENQKSKTDQLLSRHYTKSSSGGKSEQRSLVHRVFASTDSSSLSSSVMSDGSDDGVLNSNTQSSRYHIKGMEKKTSDLPSSSSHSKSSSPRISRSCSPEDLGADDAIRHTFGAFTAPFSILSSVNKVDAVRSSLQCNTTTGNDNIVSSKTKISPESESEDSKPTPPTLLMTDSSYGADQYSVGTTDKSTARDLNDWNIFSSLSKQSTPKCDKKNVHTSSSTNTPPSETNVVCADAEKNSHPDDMDELPSLEKHDDDDDDDEPNNLYDSSILLHESGSMGNRTDSFNADDDLPPPVVTAVDEQMTYTDTTIPTTSLVADVVEEVVYDGPEMQSTDNQLFDSQIQIKRDSSPTLKLDEQQQQQQSFVCNSPHPDKQDTQISSSFDMTINNSIETTTTSQALLMSTTPAFSPITLQSKIFAPVAMLATASQPKEVTAVGQTMLVTLPRSVTSPGFGSSNLTLLTGVEAATSQPFVTSAPQRHITVILPASNVSFGESVTTLQSSSAVASSVANTTGLGEFVDTPVTAVANTFSFTQTMQSPPTTSVWSSASGAELLTADSVTSSMQSVCLSSTSQSTSSVAFDPSDYTSYVQRVIERVKQEKDEEVQHHREKVKRPKKSATLQSSVVTTAATSTVVSTTNVILGTIPSSAVGLSSGLVIPGVHVCPNPMSQDEEGVKSLPSVSVSCTLPINEMLVSNSHSSVVKLGLDNCVKLNVTTSHSKKAEVENSICTEQQQRAYSLSQSNTTRESADRDVVDEVIEAVINGDFDEKDYAQKLQKGVFVYNNYSYRTPTSSIGSPGHVSDTVTPVPSNEEDNPVKCMNYKFNFSDSLHVPSPKSVQSIQQQCSSPSKEVIDPSTSTAPAGLLTPMHVLTFVATGAATPNSQQLYSSTAISPNIANQSAPNTTQYTPTIVSINSVSNPITCTGSHVDRTLLSTYAASSNTVDALSSDSSGARIEQFAAHLANNPLTTYFYSLLTQNQLSPMLSPSVSAGESVCQRPADNISLPLCTSANMKGLSIPTPISGNTSDYLAAAAKMAAMAVMGAPTQEVNTVNQNVTSTASTDVKTAHSGAHPSQTWDSNSSHIQSYPIIWRGRLSLKNEEVFVHMHYINGNQDLLKSCMNVIAEQQSALVTNSLGSANSSPVCYPLKIVQRMRLEASQLEGVQRKLRQVNDFCMCLTLAAAPPLTSEANLMGEEARMNRVLCDGFIKYMLEKCAAGIINVYHPCTQQNLFVIHIFPPCEFSRLQLQGHAPNLAQCLSQNSVPHALTVITTV